MPKNSRTCPAFGLCALIVALFGASAAAQPASRPTPSPKPTGAPATGPGLAADISKRLDDAVRSGNDRELVQALEAALSADAKVGADRAEAVLRQGTLAQRAVTCAVLARRADVATLARLVATLPGSKFSEDRRWLLMGLARRGASAGDGGRNAATALLNDQDLLVRASATHAIAELRATKALSTFIERLPRPPTTEDSWDVDRSQSLVDIAQQGAVTTLLGLRSPAPADAARFWRDNLERITKLRPGEAFVPEGDIPQGMSSKGGSERVTSSDRFDIFWRLADTDKALETSEGGSPTRVANAMDDAAGVALRNVEGVLGRLHMPIIRLYFADDRSIGGLGGSSRGAYGFARGNRIVLRLTSLAAAEAVMIHEYIHILHQAVWTDQPRWLAEGFAESFSRGPRAPDYGPGRRQPNDELRRWLGGQGLATRIVQWNTSMSSDGQPEQYAAAHVLIDYLRFSGFVEPEARLFFLMGAMHRKQNAPRVIEDLYGQSLSTIDTQIVAWLRGPSAPGPATP